MLVRGLPIYEIFFAAVWLLENILYRILTHHGNSVSIVEPRVEDWLAGLSVPVIAIFSSLGQLNFLPNDSFSVYLLITPFFLIAGLKSLYEAPKELVKNLDERE